MTKPPIRVPRGDVFGQRFDAEIHPATKLSPEALARRMEQGFSVTKASPKPKAKPDGPIKGKIKAPANTKMPSAEQVADMRAKPKRPPTKQMKRKRPVDHTSVTQVGEMFTVEPIDMREIERRAAMAKIINRRAPKAVREEFLQKLKKNQEAIAKFIMLEVATFDLALPAALEIASEYLNDTTDAGPTVDLGRVQKMLPYITEIKTLRFLCGLTGLSQADVQGLLRVMVDPETKPAVDPIQALTKLLQANKAQPAPQPPKPSRRESREKRETSARERALLQALRGR